MEPTRTTPAPFPEISGCTWTLRTFDDVGFLVELEHAGLAPVDVYMMGAAFEQRIGELTIGAALARDEAATVMVDGDAVAHVLGLYPDPPLGVLEHWTARDGGGIRHSTDAQAVYMLGGSLVLESGVFAVAVAPHVARALLEVARELARSAVDDAHARELAAVREGGTVGGLYLELDDKPPAAGEWTAGAPAPDAPPLEVHQLPARLLVVTDPGYPESGDRVELELDPAEADTAVLPIVDGEGVGDA